MGNSDSCWDQIGYQSPGVDFISLRQQIIADAFVQQMTSEAEGLRKAKDSLETALANGQPIHTHRQGLEAANEAYRKSSAQIRKHTKPQPQPKAKAAATTS